MPLVRLVFPLFIGIATYLTARIHVPWFAYATAYVTLLSVWFSFQSYWLGHYVRRWVFGAMAFGFFFTAGHHLSQQHNQLNRPEHFSHFESENDTFLIVSIAEPVAEKTNSYQVIGRVFGIADGHQNGYQCPHQSGHQNGHQSGHQYQHQSGHQNESQSGHTIRVRGKLMIYLAKDSLAASLRYGDVLVLENRFDAVGGPQNPNQFNFKRFLAHRNIYHSTYRRSGQWHHTGENMGNRLMHWSLVLRNRALMVLEQQQITGREFAVVSALLLGYREYLDEDLQREFAGAGAMHILCVSGLHVGIIYLIIQSLLAFLKKIPGGNLIKTLLTLALIWLYAAITGFSPSVLRASTMFSFVAIGHCLNRSTNIYNTLAASAFLLMVINPYIITQIGFQLSYLAVISIVSIQPFLYKQLTFRYMIFDKAWAIICVSIAAQLATGPLALYYFHQFPNYFLLTNLLVIPMASLVIYAGLLSLALFKLPFVGYICGKVLHWLLFALHSAVRWVEGLPYSTSEGVSISTPETVLICLGIVFAFRYFIHGRRKAVVAALAMACLVAVSVGWKRIDRSLQAHFVVYSLSNGTAIDFFDGRHLVSLVCDEVAGDPRSISFQADEYRIACGSPKSDIICVINDSLEIQVFSSGSWQQAGDMIQFAGQRIMVAHAVNRNLVQNLADNRESAALPNFPVDYLIITQNVRNQPTVWLEVFTPSLVILDASNSHRITSQWIEACDEMGVEVWPIRAKGAFVGKSRTVEQSKD